MKEWEDERINDSQYTKEQSDALIEEGYIDIFIKVIDQTNIINEINRSFLYDAKIMILYSIVTILLTTVVFIINQLM